MRAPRFYTASHLAPGLTVVLDDNAAQHIGRVLRMQPGQEVRLFNGDGHDYAATLSDVGKKQVSAEVRSATANPSESPLRITLGQTLSRGDRMDYAIQKSVEMGVAAIVPLTSERCEVRLKGDREDKRIRHWQAVAVSAAEQCGRAVVPEIHPVMTLSQWFAFSQHCDTRLVLHHRTARPLTDLHTPTDLALLIGPEGGLSAEEIAQAEAAGFLATALGPRVLRTETAPVAALALCQWLWGDLGQRGS
ncbi:16S rRNA (uracil(1498)-N(3))-methyltransferase [Marinobacter sp. X15-166B]|uniref:16S rRNA (uracil(1498)-N(3))-methyltransferase n=1 Tax=Marinobacter sp. X15-166B TaxID=1897620 RepID=UPI00085CAB52|nr:16S rRNA (uracil(1498)-N(3))-methyltransferase [Marinobacter sp. X15-166B]OEY65493.1 16S rRNA (uracil(1498)-N(3))-methyltransferase [Marinobacter sp. X15-166B]